MKRILPCLLLALCANATAAPAPSAPAHADAAAQQQMADLQTQMNALAARMAALSAKLGDDANATALHYLADSHRGMFGMAIRFEADGIRVDAVTPGGPAERSGLKPGDLITAIDDRPATGADTARAYAVAHLQPGKPIRFDVRRANQHLHLDITPERMQGDDVDATLRAAARAVAAVDTPAFRARIQQQVEAATRQARLAEADAARARSWHVFAAPWFGLNLAPLDPALGSYFGSNRGVLVLSRNDQQFPQLQAGDVITAIAGKPVLRPEDVQRALRDIPVGKPVQLALLRHGKPLAVSMQAPEQWLVLPPPPPPPPPAPPAPPSPPAAPPPPAPPSPPPLPSDRGQP